MFFYIVPFTEKIRRQFFPWLFYCATKFSALFFGTYLCRTGRRKNVLFDVQTWQCTFVRKRSRASSSTRRHNVIPSGFWRRKFRICSFPGQCMLLFNSNILRIMRHTYFHNISRVMFHKRNKIKFKVEIKVRWNWSIKTHSP